MEEKVEKIEKCWGKIERKNVKEIEFEFQRLLQKV